MAMIVLNSSECFIARLTCASVVPCYSVSLTESTGRLTISHKTCQTDNLKRVVTSEACFFSSGAWNGPLTSF